MMENTTDQVILIVDDDKRNTFALGSYLEIHDLQVKVMENGKEALDYLQTGIKPVVILLDMMMPVMDGYEMLAALKEYPQWQKIPVIAVTAKAMSGDREKCLQAGAWDYLSKPIDLHLLMEKITKCTQ